MILSKVKGILSVLSICIIFLGCTLYIGQVETTSKTNVGKIAYILDAGHGEPDGGCVGADHQTTEAALNLAITKKIAKNLDQKKISYQMTRINESSIYSEGETIHEKKVSDVRNRIAIAKNTPTVPLISIHMNNYPSESVYGIQVFYGNGELAQKIAKELQSAINDTLQPNHTKVAKEVSKNVYLFSHIDNPVVLIECGFLSNNNELAQLKNEEYQKKLSDVISKVLAEQG